MFSRERSHRYFLLYTLIYVMGSKLTWDALPYKVVQRQVCVPAITKFQCTRFTASFSCTVYGYIAWSKALTCVWLQIRSKLEWIYNHPLNLGILCNMLRFSWRSLVQHVPPPGLIKYALHEEPATLKWNPDRVQVCLFSLVLRAQMKVISWVKMSAENEPLLETTCCGRSRIDGRPEE